MAGVGRMFDFENFDFIKHKIKFPEAIKNVYESFGILNLFCPYRPNGSYLLKLDIYEEKLVLKILCELCRAEGYANMTDIKINGKPVAALSPEFAQALPDTGSFEGTYICPNEKEKIEVRRKIGIKYLDWEAFLL